MFDKSDLVHLELSLLMSGIKSCAQDGYAQEEIKVDMLMPSLDED